MKEIEILGANRFETFTKNRAGCRAIIVRDGMILLTHETNSGWWLVPGGGLEEDETPEECCIREVEEETGHIVRPMYQFLTLCEYYEEYRYVSHYFICEVTGSGKTHLTDAEARRGVEPQWLPLQEAVDIFSRHQSYADVSEEKRGSYLREYTALQEYMKTQNPKDQLINRFIDMSKATLAKRLAGIYLHGSAVMGCYQPKKSDLDFLVVVNAPLSDAEKRRFMDSLLELDKACPGKGIEMSIVTKDVCNPFVYPTPFILHYSRMHTEWCRRDPTDYIRKMNGTDRDLAAHFTVIRNRGRCLYGLPIQDVFDEVPEQDYLDSIWDDVSGAEEEIMENSMYLILNLARVLVYLKEKKVMSKQEGGMWGLKTLPEQYHSLIRSALQEYESGDDVQYDRELAKSYAAYMLEQITREKIRGSIMMDYSQKISERQWNLPDKGELESRREATYIDDIIGL